MRARTTLGKNIPQRPFAAHHTGYHSKMFRAVAFRPAQINRRFSTLQVPHRAKLFIHNEWCATEKEFAVSNPATETALFQCARASAADVDTAVQSARACFNGPDWGKGSSGKARAEILRKMAGALGESRYTSS